MGTERAADVVMMLLISILVISASNVTVPKLDFRSPVSSSSMSRLAWKHNTEASCDFSVKSIESKYEVMQQSMDF